MSSVRRRILGIGYPKFAIDEWKALAERYDIHYFQPEGREQVIGNIRRLCEEHGPFDAGYVLFNTSRFSPFHEDLLGPLFAKGPQCGLWAQAGVGFDDVDHKWLAKNGCFLSNTPTAVTEATGDMAVILILNTIRGTYETEQEVREGRWKDKIVPTDDPEGKTVGIIGLGAIGKVAARKLKPWDMKVIYYNRNRLPESEEKELGATWVPFDELISTSDVISLNCPLNEATRGLISKAQFEKMKDGVYIVNTARGGVIDQEALIEALKSGKVARAGLDVFTPEPLRESWLFSSPKVSVQPHLAAFTRRTFLKGEREVFANVKQYMETGTPVNPCNTPAGR